MITIYAPIFAEGSIEIPDWIGYFIIGFVWAVLFSMIWRMNHD